MGVLGRDGVPNHDRLGLGIAIADVEADAGGGVAAAREGNVGETGVEADFVAPWSTSDGILCGDGDVEAA